MAKKGKVSKVDNGNEMMNLLKLVVIVSLVVLVFYIITIFVNDKKDETADSNTPAQIQYDYILAGNILNQSNDSYYVLAKTNDDVNAKVYEAYLSNYKSEKDALRVYYVDLDNPLNSKFLNEDSNFKISNITDISFKESTLLLIKNGNISRAYEGNEEIIKILTELTKTDEE